ncbi:MAG: DNA topoisomerase IB [Actinomycetota bacterium]|nr:DNA topoisomerase IB [Actinomycetota bacterium]
MPRLRRIDCSSSGITRRRRGRGFEYIDSQGRRIHDAETLARIRDLGIPPAWTNVWICSHPRGHLQAVGTDAAGRKQYLYHEEWRKRRDAEKFEHMIEFALSLPTLRKGCADDLKQPGLGRHKILACATRLLDRGFFRIGTEGYAEQNQTYGLATMQKRHVRLKDNIIHFDFTAKSGKRRIQSLVDPDVFEVVASLKKRRGGGPELLAYKEGRTWFDVKSADINLYIKEITGSEFTAKDFRTWNATVLAAVALAVSGQTVTSKTARKRAITRAVQEVSHYLGNTPAVCRSSYIDPRVFDRFQSGWTIEPTIEVMGAEAEFGELSTQGIVEEAVLDLLEDRRGSQAIEKIA